MNKKIVEIVLGGAEAGSLRSSEFKQNEISDFYVSFSIADLSDMKNLIARIPKHIYQEEIVCNLNESVAKLYDLVDKKYMVRVWSSHLTADSYLLLLFICNLLKDKVNKLLVLYSDEYKEECYSIGTMTGEELSKLIIHEHTLSKDEIINLANKWNETVSKNSDIRFIKSNNVQSVSFDYFDNEILNLLKKNKNLRVIELIYNLSNKYFINSTLFMYLVSRLIDAKKIKVIKQGERFINNVVKVTDSIK